MIGLHNIGSIPGARHRKKRPGRGSGSAGNYSGRGIKGQKARAGSHGHASRSMKAYLLRIPKVRGFKADGVKYAIVTLADLQKHFKDGETITPRLLRKRKLIRGDMPVKVLSDGTLSKKFTIVAHRFSKEAREKIAASNGIATLVKEIVPKTTKKNKE